MIFIISGQTASGKTTLALEIAKRLKLERLISHTTRPMRIGEENGVEYHFITDEELENYNLICRNVFHTIYGPWVYGLDIDNLDPKKHYVAILEAAGAKELKAMMGDSAQIIYINVLERTRKKRAYARENKKHDPEIERRFKADAEDFINFKNCSDLVVPNVDKEKTLARIGRFVGLKTKIKTPKSKYGAVKIVVDDISFDSKMEAEYYHHLLLLKKQGIVIDFDLQPTYVLLDPFVLNDKKIQGIKYKGDFLVRYADGSEKVIDIKGNETTDFKIKKKLFQQKFQRELKCISKSNIDGGWIDLEQLKKNRAARKKAAKGK